MAIPNGIRLRHLDAFLAVCEKGTISGAAKARHISQPALSKTIGELEKLLNATLFNRVGRQTIPTAEGEIFKRHALDSLRSLDAGCGALSGQNSGSRIKVGVLPTVIGGFFPDVARDFSSKRLGVSTSIFTGPNGYLIDLLRSGRIDLMVGRMPASKDMPGLSFEYLYEESISLIARSGHPMAERPAAEAVQTYPIILPNTGAIIRGMVEEFLLSVGVQKSDPAFETVSLPFARNLLERSDMLWFISRGVVARELDRGELVSLDMGERILSGAVGLTRRLASADNPDLDHLIQLLHRKAESGS